MGHNPSTFLFYSSFLYNRHWIAPINRLHDWDFVFCARPKQEVIKWTATKKGQEFRCPLWYCSLVLKHVVIILLNHVLNVLLLCGRKNRAKVPTYFELIEIVAAVFPSQTLHYTGHRWVAQTRPCKYKKRDSCMTKRQATYRSVCSW